MIKYEVSNLGLISKYLILYKKCFKNFNKNAEYLNWLYVNNPMGSYIGIDAFDKSEIIGQLGGIPINLKFYNKHIKTFVLVNTCIDLKYRGGRIFYNLANNLEKVLKEKNFDLIIGIGNKIATPAWMRSINLKYLCQLQSYIGLINFSKIQNLKNKYNIYTDWNDKCIKWRRSNPLNNIGISDSKNFQLAYSKTSVPIFKVYSPLFFNHINEFKTVKKESRMSIKVFIGLSNEITKSLFFREIPEFLKPSPLNFLYKFLKEDYCIKKNEIFFSFLDFDAF